MLFTSSFFRRFSPFLAVNDLRRYLARRQPYEVIALFTSIFIVITIIAVLARDDASIKVPYKRDIIYVEQWPADRTDAQIRASQKADAVEQAKRDAELARLQAKRRAEFKKIDDALTAYGF